jgi:hypothetical protein
MLTDCKTFAHSPFANREYRSVTKGNNTAYFRYNAPLGNYTTIPSITVLFSTTKYLYTLLTHSLNCSVVLVCFA